MSIKIHATRRNREKPWPAIAVGLFIIVAVVMTIIATYVSIVVMARNPDWGSAVAAEHAGILAIFAGLVLLLLLLAVSAIVAGYKLYYGGQTDPPGGGGSV